MQAFRYRSFVAALASVISLSATATAQDEVAAALFREGRELKKSGNYDAACPKFVQSYARDPKTGTAFNIADCDEHAGKLAKAFLLYQRVLTMLDEGDERLPIVMARIEGLRARISRLSISADPDATVRRDGEVVATASLGHAIPVDPGVHSVVVSKQGKTELRYELVLQEGELRELDTRAKDAPATRPVDAAPPAVVPAKPAGAPRPSTSPRSSSHVPAYVALGIGAAGITTSLIGGLGVISKKSTVSDHCNAAMQCDSEGLDAASAGKTYSAIGTIGFVAGLVGLGVGGYLLFWSPDKETAVGVAPDGLRLSRSFR